VVGLLRIALYEHGKPFFLVSGLECTRGRCCFRLGLRLERLVDATRSTLRASCISWAFSEPRRIYEPPKGYYMNKRELSLGRGKALGYNGFCALASAATRRPRVSRLGRGSRARLRKSGNQAVVEYRSSNEKLAIGAVMVLYPGGRGLWTALLKIGCKEGLPRWSLCRMAQL
jgi:hypothetical protein